eukprot:g19640.t1
MKSLAPLAKFSLLGVLSNFYICAFIALRCVDGTYAKGGSLFHAAPAAPKFVTSSEGMWSTLCHPGISVLLRQALLYCFSNGFLHLGSDILLGTGRRQFRSGHFDCQISLHLKQGFLTFGQSSMGLILNNYAATDGLAVLARAAIVLSLVGFLSLPK